jgi:hypothetical protein
LRRLPKSFHRAAIKSPIPRPLPQKRRNYRRFDKALLGTRTPDPFLTMVFGALDDVLW